MERYIDKLRQVSQIEVAERERPEKNIEKAETQNPGVVCCVTLGKELHAGHLFSLTIGDQMRNLVGSRTPLILVNNNTGPRAASALCNIAQQANVELEQAAEMMDSGWFTTAEVVQAYRSRKEQLSNLDDAIEILASGQYDIFSKIAEETNGLLATSGFNVQIVSEASLSQRGIVKAQNLNPSWAGTGFMPFGDSSRLVVVEKGGILTASGVLFTSISTLSDITQTDLIVAVDSMSDASDAAFVYSLASENGSSLQMSGAGIGFNGEIASGTKGEALTMREITQIFLSQETRGSLKRAALYLTLTRPVSFPNTNNQNLGDSFYDFKNNQSLINVLIQCDKEASEHLDAIQIEVQNLQKRVSDVTNTNDKLASKLLEFLPQKSTALLKNDLARSLPRSRKVETIKNEARVAILSEELGYQMDDDNPYLSGKRSLGIRGNYYFGYLSQLIETMKKVDSLRQDEYETIVKMVNFCIERIGL